MRLALLKRLSVASTNGGRGGLRKQRFHRGSAEDNQGEHSEDGAEGEKGTLDGGDHHAKGVSAALVEESASEDDADAEGQACDNDGEWKEDKEPTKDAGDRVF